MSRPAWIPPRPAGQFAKTFTVRYARATAETEKGLCVEIPEIGLAWIAKSGIANGSQVNHLNDEGELIVGYWYASRKGWVAAERAGCFA